MEVKVISVSKFITKYYNLEGKDLKRLNHEKLQRIFRLLEPLEWGEIPSYDKTVKDGNIMINDSIFKGHINELMCGEAILIDDGHRIMAYKTPYVLYDTQEPYTYRVEKNVVDDGYYDYSTMEESEIRKHLVRTENSYRNQTEARKELKRRKIPVTKKYNRSEFKRGWRDEE
jgi:hypothetical protein